MSSSGTAHGHKLQGSTVLRVVSQSRSEPVPAVAPVAGLMEWPVSYKGRVRTSPHVRIAALSHVCGQRYRDLLVLMVWW